MIILGWNRDREAVSWPDYDEYLARFERDGRLEDLTWSVGRHRNLPAGQICFLLVQGQRHPRGLVAVGTTLSAPFPGKTWEPGRSGNTNYIWWEVEDMLPKDSPIPVSVLAQRVPGPAWLTGIQQSGYTVPRECEEALIEVWADYVGAPPQRGVARAVNEHREGAAVSGIYTRYERNPMARKACLDHYGYVCFACGLDPAAVYGPALSRRVLEVHHVVPIHTKGGVDHSVDHIRDLRPLCSNCHAAVHSVDPVQSPEQLRRTLKGRWSRGILK